MKTGGGGGTREEKERGTGDRETQGEFSFRT